MNGEEEGVNIETFRGIKPVFAAALGFALSAQGRDLNEGNDVKPESGDGERIGKRNVLNTCSTKEALSFAFAVRPLRLPPRLTSLREEEDPSKNMRVRR